MRRVRSCSLTKHGKRFGKVNGATHDAYWIGENYLTVCRQADDPVATTVADSLDAMLAGDRSHFRLEYPCHPPDDQRWFLLEATTVTHDETRYAIMAHVDITARKQAELQRDTRIEQLETIVNVLSHDLRNPLSIIRGYTEQLGTAETDGDAVAAIQESIGRMTELIDTTLAFARTQGVDDLTQVSLATIAQEAWDQTPTADASLEIEASQSFVADEHLLRQVFENLFRNAVEHGGPSVTVQVGITRGGIYVEDDGPGIPAEKRERLQDQDVSQDAKTGLGLAIVRAIVIAHDWSFSIHEGRDGGACFEISGIDSIEQV
ncbi:sensor histidine kinase [Natrinema salinisoli]|uniref:sensor histidine kinase n=1 Tax=Natrinema salinisoli TaxID=2878535 RepID=UPI001CF00720|nr:HAMP domain-containing sensor histidine kinase [Natrinema salinisoli]